MEHAEAIRLQAAERYAARELSPEERDAFEEHFFDCLECAEDVRFELTFAANVRANLREPPPERQPVPVAHPGLWETLRDWLRVHPAPAVSYAGNLLLAATLVSLLIPGARKGDQPHLAQIYFAPGPAHGAADVHLLAAGDTFYTVRFFAPSRKVSSYSFVILDVAGKRESSGVLAVPDGADESLCLQVPLTGLREGIHTLEVGAGGEIVSRSRFQTSE